MDYNIETYHYNEEHPIIINNMETYADMETFSCMKCCHIFLCFIILIIMIFGSFRIYQLL